MAPKSVSNWTWTAQQLRGIERTTPNDRIAGRHNFAARHVPGRVPLHRQARQRQCGGAPNDYHLQPTVASEMRDRHGHLLNSPCCIEGITFPHVGASRLSAARALSDAIDSVNNAQRQLESLTKCSRPGRTAPGIAQMAWWPSWAWESDEIVSGCITSLPSFEW